MVVISVFRVGVLDLYSVTENIVSERQQMYYQRT